MDDEAALVREFAPRVRAYGRKHLRSEAAADDLVQAVMVVMIESLRAGKVRERDRLPSFVLGTCRMLSMAWRRGELRHRTLLDTFGGDLAPAAEVPASAAADRMRLSGCLDRLALRERTVVVMTYYEELAAEDIATRLGMTPGNVRVVRHRALERLAGCMEVSS
jgi:RNA polymerase sigma-70 factor (ECF subfamily)